MNFFNQKKTIQQLRTDNGRLETQLNEAAALKAEEHNTKLKELSNLDDKIVELRKDKDRVNDNLKDLKAEKKREEENLQHKTKIVLEKHDIELEKKIQANDREKEEAIAEVKDEYRTKYETQLDKRGNEMKEMYNNILSHLTNVKGTLNAPVGAEGGKLVDK